MIDERALIADILAKFEKYVHTMYSMCVYHFGDTYFLLGINRVEMPPNTNFSTKSSASPIFITC